MSTSYLYHAFGVREYRYQRTDYSGGAITFFMRLPRRRWKCPECGSRSVRRHGVTWRRFQTVPTGRKPTFLMAEIVRVRCDDCGELSTIPVPFADPRRRYTRSFARYVLDLGRCMSIVRLAEFLGVSWDTVRQILVSDLRCRYRHIRLRDLTHIAIDEIYVGKGRFLTLVLDLRSGAVVYVGQGKGGPALCDFWRRLRASRARIQAVATDMASGYIAAVREHLPDAAHILDRFHIMKLFNEKLSNLRRRLFRNATSDPHRQILKGTRWLLLKRSHNLDDDRNERQRLDDALRLNEPLSQAYYLKEEIALFWEQPDRATALDFLDDWLARAQATGVREVQLMASHLNTHRDSLLDWYEHPISTGPLEGMNNKIKTLQRQAYGFRNAEFFRLSIHDLHNQAFTRSLN